MTRRVEPSDHYGGPTIRIQLCRSCAHHPGDHRGWRGYPGAICTVPRCQCPGYSPGRRQTPQDAR